MPKATLIFEPVPEELKLAEQWKQEWRDALTFISEDEGCGCCVHIFKLEGSQEAIDAIPPAIRGASASWDIVIPEPTEEEKARRERLIMMERVNAAFGEKRYGDVVSGLTELEAFWGVLTPSQEKKLEYARAQDRGVRRYFRRLRNLFRD